MHRVFIISLSFFILFVFSFPVFYLFTFVLALFLPFRFYEILFFGIISDVIAVSPYPFYTLLSFLILFLSFFIRKRMHIHV